LAAPRSTSEVTSSDNGVVRLNSAFPSPHRTLDGFAVRMQPVQIAILASPRARKNLPAIYLPKRSPNPISAAVFGGRTEQAVQRHHFRLTAGAVWKARPPANPVHPQTARRAGVSTCTSNHSHRLVRLDLVRFRTVTVIGSPVDPVLFFFDASFPSPFLVFGRRTRQGLLSLQRRLSFAPSQPVFGLPDGFRLPHRANRASARPLGFERIRTEGDWCTLAL